ncbi:MAG: TonB-dependent receptor [Deltaproteobacteria bacterium]|nr:TonB-dependent receptor [Deltaproteobacteria bacterium]
MKVWAYLFFCLVPIAVRIHAAEPPEVTLPPVVVTATRLQDVQEPVTNVPGKVIVVTAEEFQKLGAKTIQDVLQYQTGIVLYDPVGNEFQQTIDLRGFNGQPVTATSVFVDGVRINEPDFNTINFDLIPVEDIDRIEILPGTATVFGRNALGGAINITTKRGRNDRPHFGFDVGGGSFGRQKYWFSTDGPLPLSNFDYYFGFTRELSNGFREEMGNRMAGARITRLFTKLGYRRNDTTDATLSYTHVLDHLRQAGSLPGSRLRLDRNDNLTPGDFTASDLDLVALNIRQKLPVGLSIALNGFLRNNQQELFVRGLTTESTLRTDTISGGTTIQLTHDGNILGRKNLSSIGFEYSHNSFDIENSGVFFPAFSFLSRQATSENVFGAYLTDSFNLSESLVLNAGFRYDWDRIKFNDKIDPSLDGKINFSRFSPKAGLVYTLVNNWQLSFSYSEGIRIPTVTEIFAQGPFGSNPDLKPMKSRNFELGLKGRLTDWLEASLAFFYMPVRDEIFFIATDPLDPFSGRNENIEKTLRRGIEFTLKAAYKKWLDGFFNYTVTKATFDGDFFVPGINFLDPPRLVKKGDELPLVPRHRVGVGVNVRPLEGLTLSLFGNYVGTQYQLRDEPNQAKKLTDYFVLNSRVAYQWREWTAHVTLNNLTDRKYSTSGILIGAPFNESFRVPAPGINVFAGLSFRY